MECPPLVAESDSMSSTIAHRQFMLSDEHQELQAVLSALCETQIAPYSAEVDKSQRLTHEAEKALTAAGSRRFTFPRHMAARAATLWPAAS